MTQIKDGGPAFPRPQAETSIGGNYEQDGMTLHQYYVGQALAGLCANSGGPFQANPMNGWGIVNCTVDDIAAECVRLADATISALAAREERQS